MFIVSLLVTKKMQQKKTNEEITGAKQSSVSLNKF
jgi:hypothetical protein